MHLHGSYLSGQPCMPARTTLCYLQPTTFCSTAMHHLTTKLCSALFYTLAAVGRVFKNGGWWLLSVPEMMQLAGNCIMNATASCSKHCSRKGRRKTVPEEALADHHQSVSAEPCGLWLPWNPQLSQCGGCRQMPDLRRPPRIGPAHAASSEALPCLND